MAILVLLCFTFAGCAGMKAGNKIFVTDTVKMEREAGSDKIKVNGKEESFVDGKIVEGKKTGRDDLDKMLDKIETKNKGDVTTTYNETCWWKWDGTKWVKKCVN
ncbi:MAG: hypothetical protein JSV28_03440 [Deltaproteobacteria bacterium]|nr:MAG: hypothetical protein JSV28_03440 [Deltaproteobacteria bacterium]